VRGMRMLPSVLDVHVNCPLAFDEGDKHIIVEKVVETPSRAHR